MICPVCKGERTILKKEQGKSCYEVVLGICDKCHGTGEIKATNFQRITASPEVLAEILTDIQTDGHFGVDCMTYEERLEWLMQESKK